LIGLPGCALGPVRQVDDDKELDMTRAITSLIRHAIRQVKETWSEVDYAQRRMLEIQMGRRFVSPARPSIARSVDELESLFAR